MLYNILLIGMSRIGDSLANVLLLVADFSLARR